MPIKLQTAMWKQFNRFMLDIKFSVNREVNISFISLYTTL